MHLDLDGGSLTIDEAVRLARHGGRATLSTAAIRRVEATRALKSDLIAREIPIYGVTTGFGDSAHRQIAPEKAAQLQQNMLRFLGAGTGQIASPEVTRATMLFRANCLAKGNSGVRLRADRAAADAAQPRHPAADPRARLVRRERRSGAALLRRPRAGRRDRGALRGRGPRGGRRARRARPGAVRAGGQGRARDDQRHVVHERLRRARRRRRARAGLRRPTCARRWPRRR